MAIHLTNTVWTLHQDVQTIFLPTLLANPADNKLVYFSFFFFFFLNWYFMQIFSSGDNLHEMLNPVFWEK